MRPMEDAPKDGTPIMLFAKWAPDIGMVCRWAYHPGTNSTGWVSGPYVGGDLAVFDWLGWEPLTSQNAPGLLVEGARTEYRKNYNPLPAQHGQRRPGAQHGNCNCRLPPD
jgi:hypothetical protein